MEHALKLFQNQLPTLSQLKAHNEGTGNPPETAWIWGKDDEVGRPRNAFRRQHAKL